MPTPTKGPRMGGSPAHERHMLANLATSLFEHGRITTTEAKAKRLRPYAEHLITFAKRGDLHARRQVLKRLNDKSVVHTLFDQIGPRFANRPGGYTRIVKLGTRKGDNAPMALIELVEAMTVAQQAVGEAERARGSRFAGRQAPTGATREAAEGLAGESATAAAVAAAPTVDDIPAGEATQDAAAAQGAVDPAPGVAEPAGSEILPVDGEQSGAGAPAAVVTPAQEPVGDSAGEMAAPSGQGIDVPAEGSTSAGAAGDEVGDMPAAAGTPLAAAGDEVGDTPPAAVTPAEAAVDEAAGGAAPGEHPTRDGE